MLFANFTQDANGQAALALVAGIIKVLRDGQVFERDELVAIFEEALRILPESALTRDIVAREAVSELLKETVRE
ncbi:MAG: hypothetical protein JWO70_4335 [Betaproteobacteria bacterium]|nr:hypothetical protein [Betaproteobacteria bacterium]